MRCSQVRPYLCALSRQRSGLSFCPDSIRLAAMSAQVYPCLVRVPFLVCPAPSRAGLHARLQQPLDGRGQRCNAARPIGKIQQACIALQEAAYA